MSRQTARTYDTGKKHDVAALNRLLDRHGKLVSGRQIRELREALRKGERVLVVIDESVDRDLAKKNRKKKRSQARKSRKANR